MSRVPLLDYAFLAFETDSSPKHVGGLQIFELPPRAGRDYVAELVAKARETLPEAPFNLRLHTPVVGRPDWQRDPVFDFDNHIFHERLLKPGSMAELLARVSELHAENLDRSVPLWEMHFFERLDNNRFAIYFKVHHAYMDGIGLSGIAMAALSDAPDPDHEIAFWAQQRYPFETSVPPLLESIVGGVRRAGRAVLAGAALGRVGLLHALRLAGLSGRELPIPFTAPRTAFNSRLTRRRCVDVMTLPLERMQWIAAHTGVTVNDVLIELCDSAMTRYLDAHHDIPDRPLVAQMPVSLRRDDAGQQNQITIALLELGDDEDDPVHRLQRIHRHTNDVKYEFRRMPAEAAEAYTVILQSLAQFGEVTGLGEKMPPLGNVVISNVIGPASRKFLAEAPLLAVYPVSTIAPGLAINVTSYTYNGQMHIGVVTGASAIPDIEVLMTYFRAALPALERGLGLPGSDSGSDGGSAARVKKKTTKKTATKRPKRQQSSGRSAKRRATSKPIVTAANGDT